MKNHVFYSWQSILPDNTNRGFLETCITDALKELNISDLYDVEFSVDKDTKDEAGTPHIAETIFSKIEKSKLFIADDLGYSYDHYPGGIVLVKDV